VKKINLIVCAHSIYPDSPSSEGIVNKNWFEIIKTKTDNIYLVSALTIISKTNENLFITHNDWFSSFILKVAFASKMSIKGLFYGILNKVLHVIRVLPNGLSLYYYSWAKYNSLKSFQILKKHSDIVIWTRITPTFSLLPILIKWEKITFPLIININDPIENNLLNSASIEEKILYKTKNKAQCWTFPSQQLANEIALKFDLDITRCFVIPHAMRSAKNIYYGNPNKKRKLNFLYTGTFYKSAFTTILKNDLIKFSKSELAKEVNFTFVLSQYNQNSIDWIKEAIPSAIIKTKLTREEVLQLNENADCMMIMDAISHKNLLKGKFIEAISHGLPVFAITYENSVMDKVTKEYGCSPAYQNTNDDVFFKLNELVYNLRKDDWCNVFFKKRTSVMNKISEDTIAEISMDIIEFAYNRYHWQQDLTKPEPKIKNNYSWP
jgi:cytochrome b involved in lipid metabolism